MGLNNRLDAAVLSKQFLQLSFSAIKLNNEALQ